MKIYILTFFFSFLLIPVQNFGQEKILLSTIQDVNLAEHLVVLNDPNSVYTIQEVLLKKDKFRVFNPNDSFIGDQWIHFVVHNPDSVAHKAKASIAFVDHINFYIIDGNSIYSNRTGDLLPMKERNVHVGQMCLVDFEIPERKSVDCYLKLHSSTDISKQFRSYSLGSVQLYSETPFIERFVTSRIYQALFFGAIMMMLLYNIFIFSTTRSLSYLSYVGFLLSLIIFIASNNGYIVELILPNYPRVDLYIRLLSAPFTLITFLIFARHYLESQNYTPKLNRILSIFIAAFIFILIFMLSGFWKEGRTFTIIISILSFFFILCVAFIIMRKGYTPARYFIIANFLLIVGAIFFSMERFHFVIQNPVTQYSVQISVIFQSVFFSIGLADRIKLVQLQIANVEVEKEKLETLRQTERKNLTEEKNIALEASNKELDAFIYKTAHDIRGPIARLMGLSNVGLIEIKDPKSQTYLNLLKNNAYYLNYLINRLSTSYDIRKREVVKSNFNLDQLIRIDVIKELTFHEEYNEVTLKLELEKDLIIHSDQTLIRFVLINLLDNAVKFRDKGNQMSSEILAKITLVNGILIINVSEYGIGIKEDEKPYLFEMFSKAAGKYKSPGLGLYMSKLSVEKLNGTICLLNSSNPTTFGVQIPL